MQAAGLMSVGGGGAGRMGTGTGEGISGIGTGAGPSGMGG